MADGKVINLDCQRNDDLLRAFSVNAEAAALSIKGWQFLFAVAQVAGGAALASVRTVATAGGSVITVNEDASKVTVMVKNADIATLPGNTEDTVTFAYNLIATDTSGARRAIARGQLSIKPGV